MKHPTSTLTGQTIILLTVLEKSYLPKSTLHYCLVGKVVFTCSKLALQRPLAGTPATHWATTPSTHRPLAGTPATHWATTPSTHAATPATHWATTPSTHRPLAATPATHWPTQSPLHNCLLLLLQPPTGPHNLLYTTVSCCYSSHPLAHTIPSIQQSLAGTPATHWPTQSPLYNCLLLLLQPPTGPHNLLYTTVSCCYSSHPLAHTISSTQLYLAATPATHWPTQSPLYNCLLLLLQPPTGPHNPLYTTVSCWYSSHPLDHTISSTQLYLAATPATHWPTQSPLYNCLLLLLQPPTGPHNPLYTTVSCWYSSHPLAHTIPSIQQSLAATPATHWPTQSPLHNCLLLLLQPPTGPHNPLYTTVSCCYSSHPLAHTISSTQLYLAATPATHWPTQSPLYNSLLLVLQPPTGPHNPLYTTVSCCYSSHPLAHTIPSTQQSLAGTPATHWPTQSPLYNSLLLLLQPPTGPHNPLYTTVSCCYSSHPLAHTISSTQLSLAATPATHWPTQSPLHNCLLLLLQPPTGPHNLLYTTVSCCYSSHPLAHTIPSIQQSLAGTPATHWPTQSPLYNCLLLLLQPPTGPHNPLYTTVSCWYSSHPLAHTIPSIQLSLAGTPATHWPTQSPLYNSLLLVLQPPTGPHNLLYTTVSCWYSSHPLAHTISSTQLSLAGTPATHWPTQSPLHNCLLLLLQPPTGPHNLLYTTVSCWYSSHPLAHTIPSIQLSLAATPATHWPTQSPLHNCILLLLQPPTGPHNPLYTTVSCWYSSHPLAHTIPSIQLSLAATPATHWPTQSPLHNSLLLVLQPPTGPHNPLYTTVSCCYSSHPLAHTIPSTQLSLAATPATHWPTQSPLHNCLLLLLQPPTGPHNPLYTTVSCCYSSHPLAHTISSTQLYLAATPATHWPTQSPLYNSLLLVLQPPTGPHNPLYTTVSCCYSSHPLAHTTPSIQQSLAGTPATHWPTQSPLYNCLLLVLQPPTGPHNPLYTTVSCWYSSHPLAHTISSTQLSLAGTPATHWPTQSPLHNCLLLVLQPPTGPHNLLYTTVSCCYSSHPLAHTISSIQQSLAGTPATHWPTQSPLYNCLLLLLQPPTGPHNPLYTTVSCCYSSHPLAHTTPSIQQSLAGTPATHWPTQSPLYNCSQTPSVCRDSGITHSGPRLPVDFTSQESLNSR